ncbi:MAG: ethylbenzene dehydrogenase-related protein [Bdellovibrionota bacterium]
MRTFTAWMSLLLSSFLFLGGADKAFSKDAGSGQALYEANCAICHGVKGDGRGPGSYLLSPKPRDFTKGIFKFKSTPTGSLPADSDLLRVIGEGIPGTSMPSWPSLDEASRREIVAYIKTFSPRFQSEQPAAAVSISDSPVLDAASIERGKKAYETLACVACHGAAGRGDGIGGSALKDAWGDPIRPLNFTSGAKMRGGGTARDLFRTLKVGMEGTPMPVFGYLPDDQLWDLAAYVHSLGIKQPPFKPSADAAIAVKVIDGEIPLAPDDARWRESPAVGVAVRPLWSRDKAPDYVMVRGMTNGKEIAFCVEWADASAETAMLRPQDFRDAVALQFPVLSEQNPDAPLFAMGSKDKPVNIWHWKADWQRDLAGFQDMGTQYAGLAIDAYPRDAEERRAYQSGWAAGNPMSVRDHSSPVEDLTATGIGTLTSQPVADQNVDGRGVWSDGEWRVVFRRSLSSSGESDARFSLESADKMRLAVAVWDGAASDRNGQKLVSEWRRLRVDGAPRQAAKGGGCVLSNSKNSVDGASLLLMGAFAMAVLRRRRYQLMEGEEKCSD